MNALKKVCRFHTTDMIRHIILAWIFAAAVELIALPGYARDLGGLECLRQMSLLRMLTITFVGTAALQIASNYLKTKHFERWNIVGIFAFLSVVSLITSFSWGLLAACILTCVILCFYARFGSDKSVEQLCNAEPASRKEIWITVALSAAFFLFVSIWTICKIDSFKVATFDFGLFAQMFHQMKQTGAPMTTLERDRWLSHLHVHMSPIYYLLLPFYYLVPRPETLQVLQAAVLVSSVIPMWKIAKLHGFGGKLRTLLCAVLLLYPALAGGAGFDLHENCFLTPLILWLFYGLDSGKLPITICSAVLTLMVKEDAPVYVAIIALWFMAKTALQKGTRKNLILGACLLAGALTWFYAATSFLANVGDGVMTNRYENFIYDDSNSLITVIKAVFLNPMKAIYESVETNKLGFIAQTMVPLLFLPFVTRKYVRYILLIPYFLINLMSDYKYQHSIHVQYNFGVLAFLLYLTVVNLADIRLDRHRLKAASAAVLASVVFFGIFIVPRAVKFPYRSIVNHEEYTAVRKALSMIPDDAVVTVSTHYSTYLSARDTIYDVLYCPVERTENTLPKTLPAHLLESEYIALEVNDKASYKPYDTYEKSKDGFVHLTALIEQNGFEVFYEIEDLLVIYKKVQ